MCSPTKEPAVKGRRREGWTVPSHIPRQDRVGVEAYTKSPLRIKREKDPHPNIECAGFISKTRVSLQMYSLTFVSHQPLSIWGKRWMGGQALRHQMIKTAGLF